MRVLHLCLSCFYIDNYGYQENMLPKYHVLQGHEVKVIASLVSFDSKGRPCLLKNEGEYLAADGYIVARTDYKRPFYRMNKRFRRYNNVYRDIAAFRPDTIFMHDCQFWDIFEVIKYLKQHPRVQVFVDGHTDLLNSARTWLSREILHKIVWKYCAQAIEPYTTTFFGVLPIRCDFFSTMYGIPPQKIELLVMGVDDASIPYDKREQTRTAVRHELGLSEDDFVLVTGGKIDKNKNVDVLTSAVKRIKANSIKLIVFGTINPNIEENILRLTNDSRIKFVGWVESKHLYRYFFAADLAVFPGSHSVLWEYAVGCGLPALVRRWPGMDHMDVGGNGAYLSGDSIDELTRAIVAISSDPARYQKMRDAAVAKGVDAFSYSKIAARALQHS
jgi:1,2-diacylglycerol 3-alpha-glucosyltransferase